MLGQLAGELDRASQLGKPTDSPVYAGTDAPEHPRHQFPFSAILEQVCEGLNRLEMRGARNL